MDRSQGPKRKTWQGGPKVTRARHVAETKALVAKIKETPCMDCGQQFPPQVMEFDHRNPDEKFMAVATMVGTAYRLETILTEIAKCDLVCANCHRIRHITKDVK